MKTFTHFLLAACIVSLCGCSRCSPRKKLNEGGEIVGNTIGEFTEGVASGVDKSFQINLNLSDELKARGLETGKVKTGATGNVLVAYFIYNSDFSDTVTVKAFDSKNVEIGRQKVGIAGKKGDAGYVDIIFDARTSLAHDSRIVVE